MTPSSLTRRRLLGGLGVATLAPLPARAQGEGTPAQRFRAVGVDLSVIIDKGAGGGARALAPILLQKMQLTFADLLTPKDPRAPLLTARITHLYLSFYVERGQGNKFGNMDNIEGDGVVSNGGRLLSVTHVLTELPASYSGYYLDPNIDVKRLDSIAYQFTYWLRREMGLGSPSNLAPF